MKEDISPVKLNALKHHFSFLKSRVDQWKTMDWAEVKDEIQELGNNQFDVYFGRLPVQEIVHQVNDFLIGHKLINRAKLQKWLGKTGYKTLILSDQSRWVIRESESPLNPVHLHPGRNQLQVRRIRATHLKTAIAMIYGNIAINSSQPEFTTLQINNIRISMLGLSPVKSIRDCLKILETVNLLTEEQKESMIYES